MSRHPMYQTVRPRIATRCIEALADAIKLAIEDGYRGIQVHGRSRDGKTEAAKYLQNHPTWLDNPTLILNISMTRRTNYSDSSFYKMVQDELQLNQHSHSGAINRMRQITDRIIAGCMEIGCTQAVLFIDEAQHLSDNDFEFLTNIDNATSRSEFQLFCVFIYQTDDAKAEKRRKRSRLIEELPPHVTGRYFMAEHVFSGLRGSADIRHALDQYDSRLRFDGKYFTEYFSETAFAAGWRFASHATDFVTAMSSLRTSKGLQSSDDLAMQVFDVACYRLLARVAPETPNFAGFDQSVIKLALIDAGYLQIEVVRQRQVSRERK